MRTIIQLAILNILILSLPASAITKYECGKALYSKEVIQFVQQSIKLYGIDTGPVDGIYGKRTKQGISQYRKNNKLALIDTIALDLINSLVGGDPREVAEIQKIHGCFGKFQVATTVQGKIKLDIPTAFATKLPGIGTTITRVSRDVEQMSGGNMEMKVYEPNKLIPPFEILDAVSVGNINAGYTLSGYWADKIPAAPLFSAVPFGPEAGEFLAWMWRGNGRKLYQEMYDMNEYNVHVTPCGIIAPETSGWFKKEIKEVKDLKGLNMRFFGLGAKVMQKLGVNTSLLPGGEIFKALESGAIDATEFSMPAIDSRLGFHKIAKFNYFPGWHQQATIFELLINKTTWKKLSTAQKAIIEVSCKAAMAESLAEGEAIQYESMIKNRDENGVKIMVWPKKILDAYRTAWDEVVQEESKNDAFFKKVYTDMNAFRDNYKIWKTHAFLPRN